ncbi:hypothetical protein AAFF_G00285340 [Aldrovandia affinis]|uniref:Uncharacterized protein n=1 Tax=Aldrovandia affinis TaxID=143900 RepID=A0AAD7TAY6_9TELE|nr:hypothetical protein AAFF_G00285340 [Aldrovandia affinis]
MPVRSLDGSLASQAGPGPHRPSPPLISERVYINEAYRSTASRSFTFSGACASWARLFPILSPAHLHNQTALLQGYPPSRFFNISRLAHKACEQGMVLTHPAPVIRVRLRGCVACTRASSRASVRPCHVAVLFSS